MHDSFWVNILLKINPVSRPLLILFYIKKIWREALKVRPKYHSFSDFDNRIDFQSNIKQKLLNFRNVKMNLVSLQLLALLFMQKIQKGPQNRIGFQKNIHPKTITHSKSENESCGALTFGAVFHTKNQERPQKQNWFSKEYLPQIYHVLNLVPL